MSLHCLPPAAELPLAQKDWVHTPLGEKSSLFNINVSLSLTPNLFSFCSILTQSTLVLDYFQIFLQGIYLGVLELEGT